LVRRINIRRSRHARAGEATEKYLLWHYKRRRPKKSRNSAVFCPDPAKNRENHQDFGEDGLIDRQPTGAYLFQNSPAVMDAIRDLRNHTISHLDLRISQPHQEGHQHA
jgi:hypothetical protein